MKNKRIISLIMCLSFLFSVSPLSQLKASAASVPDSSKNMKIGLNVFANDFLRGELGYENVTLNGKLVDYTVCHFDPASKTVSQAIKDVEFVSEKFKESGTDFIANFEFQNFDLTAVGPDGYSWIDNSNGCHRLTLHPDYLKALAKCENCKGIMLDEFEHTIINKNASIQLDSKLKYVLPVFPLADTRDAYTQGEYLNEQLNSYVESIKSSGIKSVYGENVFPVLYHKFAQTGIMPNFKSQKESYTTVQYAIAAGAALEYGIPLSTCIDNWYFNKSPGHSAEEMYQNFVFAYYAGVNEAYSESIHIMTVDSDGRELTDHGKKFMQFCEEYKGKERNYDISDYRPEIGIIRYDDTYYGQWLPIIFQGVLFGNNKIRPDYRSKEYIKVLNLLTNGESARGGISWDMFKPASLKKHRSFSTFNSTAVFDHQVRKQTLDSLKLCFLCGIYISDETIKDVRDCVQNNGMTVVTTKRFLPKDIAAKVKCPFCEIKDGKGKWLVVDSFNNILLKPYLKPYLGKKNEMRLTFKDKEVIMQISKDGNSFTVKQ